MMALNILIIILYTILGIGYSKLLLAYYGQNGDREPFLVCFFIAIAWPVWLVMSAFWNFK